MPVNNTDVDNTVAACMLTDINLVESNVKKDDIHSLAGRFLVRFCLLNKIGQDSEIQKSLYNHHQLPK